MGHIFQTALTFVCIRMAAVSQSWKSLSNFSELFHYRWTNDNCSSMTQNDSIIPTSTITDVAFDKRGGQDTGSNIFECFSDHNSKAWQHVRTLPQNVLKHLHFFFLAAWTELNKSPKQMNLFRASLAWTDTNSPAVAIWAAWWLFDGYAEEIFSASFMCNSMTGNNKKTKNNLYYLVTRRVSSRPSVPPSDTQGWSITS